ncbi:ATP-binding/permease protein CydD [Paraliobacillus sp. PM-2]|uniref:thiol reductant ABC exporter subunit CydD n=1 Tax=Paraliobacillus sp. PM-2 TaxID=1462524 RepID=UPI00061BB56A|nr:thiol reductant ABC exporter subunit CydD [Paraliobacillus sp. PM-2]CQR47558.1 ATP-binding/permease protein CydD [Paraliobacillus sp. PM-2]
MQRIKQSLSAHRTSLILLLLLTLLLGIAIIVQAFSITLIVNDVFLEGVRFSSIMGWLALLLLALMVRSIADYYSKKIGVRIASAVKKETRAKLLDRYKHQMTNSEEQGLVGEKVSMLLDGVDEMDSFYSQFIPQVMQSAFVPLLTLIIICTQHINSGIILMITAPFIPIFMIVIGIKTQKKSEEKLEQMAAFSGAFLDTLKGLVTLKIFNQTDRKKDELEKSSLGFRDTTMEILKIAFTQSFMLEVISMLSIGLVALEIAFQLVLYDGISFFTAFFVLILVPEFFTALKELGTTFHNGRSSMGATKKVFESFEETISPVEWGVAELPHTDQTPTIALENVSFHYAHSGFSLENINLYCNPNERIAIVGPSGAGKSTLLHLLAGMIGSAQGDIKINNESLANYTEESWLRQVSYISQEPYIFSGTIAENIALGSEKAVDLSEIKLAAEKAGISALIESLPDQYQTCIGEGARGLSSGEKQRIAIARAFIKQPNVVLLDEPTRGLDLQTEKILQQSTKELQQFGTIITIAHRLHTIKDANKIVFLQDGKITGIGTHQELIDSLAAYREMVTIQQGGTEHGSN